MIGVTYCSLIAQTVHKQTKICTFCRLYSKCWTNHATNFAGTAQYARNIYKLWLNLSLMCCIKLKYYGNFYYITQIIHLNAHLNPIKGIFSEKLHIAVEILSFQFEENFNSQEMWLRKVLSFSHVSLCCYDFD